MKPNDLNAPIERIYRRVATDGQLKGYNEEPARFQPSDFYLSEEFVERLQNDQADGKAIDFVYELLEPEDERPAATATYLNQFLDSVIQKAAGIHPGDFESIFAEIRHELYLHGERLTLLIEDITAFTGINESLLNVLIDEHTGTTDRAGSERCRLSSVVGTTTQFYGEFRDNFRNRVTEEIYIEDTALTADRDDALLELSARYLNALSLPASDLATWAEEGALAEKLPINQRVEQSYWPTFTLPTGQVLSLYPFTALALRNLVAGMREGQRTPRYFLTDVMRPTILHVIKDTLVAFPPVYTGTKPNLQWQNTEDRIYIMGQCSEEEQERLNRFVCIWGDGTAKQIEQDNISYLAGIPLPIYQELGFPNIHGRKYTTANTNAVSPLSSVTKKVASVTQNTAKTPTKYDSQRENLDKWLNGDMLMDHHFTTF